MEWNGDGDGGGGCNEVFGKGQDLSRWKEEFCSSDSASVSPQSGGWQYSRHRASSPAPKSLLRITLASSCPGQLA